jgi:hypothetical protein
MESAWTTATTKHVLDGYVGLSDHSIRVFHPPIAPTVAQMKVTIAITRNRMRKLREVMRSSLAAAMR